MILKNKNTAANHQEQIRSTEQRRVSIQTQCKRKKIKDKDSSWTSDSEEVQNVTLKKVGKTSAIIQTDSAVGSATQHQRVTSLKKAKTECTISATGTALYLLNSFEVGDLVWAKSGQKK